MPRRCRRCCRARPAPYRDTVLLNAAAALIVAASAADLREGVALAAARSHPAPRLLRWKPCGA